jgi:hypothetical protein
VLEVVNGREQARHFVTTQDDRQLVRDMHRAHLRHQLGAIQGRFKEKLEPGEGRIQ